MPTAVPSEDPGVDAAARALTTALEAHLAAVKARNGESDPAVFAAFDDLRDAFLAYEEALYDGYDEVLPVEVVEEYDADEPPDPDAPVL